MVLLTTVLCVMYQVYGNGCVRIGKYRKEWRYHSRLDAETKTFRIAKAKRDLR